MYTQQDLIKVCAQRNRRILFSSLVLLLLVATLVAGLVLRLRWAASLGSAVWACLYYFLLDTKAMPYVRYARFLEEMQVGRRHSCDAVFSSLSEKERFVDGIEVYDLMARTGDTPDTESLFYFDADKPRPSLEPGQSVRIDSYGKFITGIEAVHG